MTAAGHGARQQQAAARLRVEDAERQLAAARAREHAWSAGADGEEQVADALIGLEQLGWVVLHDVAWPGRARANLDHVLLGPGGVLVVDTKNWSGTVTVDTARGLRSNGYRKTKEVHAVEAARQAVLPLVPAPAQDFVVGLICLAGQEQEPVRLDGGTLVVGRAQLRQHVSDLPAVLSPQVVMDAAVTLGQALRRPLDRVPTQAARAAKPRGGSSRSRKRPARSGRADAVKLAILAVLIGGFLLFPDQVLSAYMSVVDAVVSPVADDLVQDLQDNMAPTPAP